MAGANTSELIISPKAITMFHKKHQSECKQLSDVAVHKRVLNENNKVFSENRNA